jgi:lipopolysaccharide transport system ATP-binding protein
VSSGRTIQFDGVWKSYPRWGGPGSGTLRAALRRRIPGQAVPRERRWALQDISCTFESGLATGIIGANGAGKSTMLRLASGVGAATRGRILLPANTASVLNLGYVFDATLTGAENAVTAALMAGMSAARARAVLPAVLEFAELEAFAEAPLRTYSDGMRLRLAFGVVAQLRPDALLLDEVMAVGDLRFQAKCLHRIEEMRADGTTVVFASHSLEQVAEQCDRALWLQGGVARLHADAAEVVQAYTEAMQSETLERTPAPVQGAEEGELELGRNRFGSQEVVIEGVQIVAAGGAPTLVTGSAAQIRLRLRAEHPVESPRVIVTVQRASDGVICVDLTSEASGSELGTLSGGAEVVLHLDDLALLPGDYVADVGVYEQTWQYAYDLHLAAYSFAVAGASRGHGVYTPSHAWEIRRP